MSEEQKKVISFGQQKLSPEEEAEYRKKIAMAQSGGGVNMLKGREPVGKVERPPMPDFQALKDERDLVAKTGMLSPNTQQQLAGLADAVKAETEKKQEEEKKKQEEDSLFEAIDFAGQRSEAERILNNKKLRDDIEARCSPMKVEDLLYKDEVQQTVPIIPGTFEVIFRSTTQAESLFVKRTISQEPVYSDQYTLEKYNLCYVVMSLVAINGKPLPDHRDKNGDPEDKAFQAKLAVIQKKSGYVIASLGVNYAWFDIRVRKLLTPEALKNG